MRIKGDIAHKILRTVPGICKQSMYVNYYYYYCLCELCIYNCFCCYYLHLSSGAISKAQCAKCPQHFPGSHRATAQFWPHISLLSTEALSILGSVSVLPGAGREGWSLSAVEKAAPGNCFLFLLSPLP